MTSSAIVSAISSRGGGLWSVAARIAGWPDNRPLWTGSCPCQPHSSATAGRGRRFEDDRDLWPSWLRLIRECGPTVVAGEQVDDNAAWIDRMHDDMEAAGYAVGALDLATCCVDAPTTRMRTYFVADTDGAGQCEQGWAFSMAPERFPFERAGRGSRFGGYRTTGELGKVRRVEPGVRILSDDVPGRVALLRVGGNAINPIVAAEFLAAYLDGRGDA